MQHVTITQVHVGSVNTKNGPKQKVGIKTNMHGDQWLSAFDDRGFIAQKAKEGWSGPIIVDQNGNFLNFRFPTKTDYLEERISRLEEKLGVSSLGDRPASLSRPNTTAAQGFQLSVNPGPAASTNMEWPNDINPDDIPF